MVSVTVIEPEDLSSKLNRILKQELTKAEDEISRLLLKYAKEQHRFESRTGKLESAVKIKGNLEKGLELYVDLNVADYGRYVVNGANSWNKDDFINEALDNNRDKITSIIDKAISNTTQRMNAI